MKGFSKYCFGGLLLPVLLLVSNGVNAAPVPSTDLADLPATHFVGEQFCFDAPVSNSGEPGFAPYLRLKLPPGLSFDTATFLGVSVSSQNLGTFPPDLSDPLTGELITGTDGYSLITLKPPIGSIVSTGPALNINICSTIDVNAPIGVPLEVNLQPVLQLGDTATGDNGPISGAEISANITPTIVKFEKKLVAPESERPPGASWPITYQLTADIANGKTIFDLNFADVLPADLQYVANSISVVGGTACVPSVLGQLVTASCSEASGTTADTDVVVSLQAFVKDVLDETQCTSRAVTNTAIFNANRRDALNNDIALGPLNSAETVSAEHITMQKSVTPGGSPNFVSPGDTLAYTVNMQVSDFGSANSLVFNDVLPDGVQNFVHTSLSLNGSALAITPNTTSNANGTISVAYDIGAVAGSISSGSSLSLIYTVDIKQFYQSGDTVKANDFLVNNASITYGLTAGASNCSNSSSATAKIKPLQLSKEIINPKAEYQPGELVTFRLTMQVPSGDTADIVFEDFFPLPVFDVTRFTTDETNYGGIGSAADIRRAATDTLNLTPTSITVDAAANKLEIIWPDVNTTSAQTLAVEVDAIVSSKPFADNLSLTNLFQVSTKNSPLTPAVDLSLTGIDVRAPVLTITKGVLSTDNPNSTISPAPGTPVDGNLTNADAQDTLVFELTVENTGGAPAHDVNVSDDLGLPASLLSGCAVASVEDGTGAALAYTSAATFDGNISLNNPLAANDENPSGGGAPYSGDTAIIQVSCTLAQAVEPGEIITNTASATWASGAGDSAFAAVEEDATISINNPNITKSLVGGPSFTIGDIIRYEIVITIPELTINNVILNDTLDPGLAFVDISEPANFSITNSSGVSNSVFSASVTGAGSSLEIDLGTVTNTNSGNTGTQTITISYDVVVLNTSASNAGDTKNNAVNLSSTSYNSATVNAENITVVEPNVVVDKTVLTAGPYDAGDTVTYEWHVRQTGSNLSDAFEVVLSDALPENVTYTAGTLAAVGACPNLVLDDSNGNGSPATLNASWSTFSVSEDCRIQYSVTLDTAVAAGTSLNNVVDIAWSSLAGTVAGPLSIYNTNSCERTSVSDPNRCGSGNDFDDSANASITINDVIIKKLLTSTSEAITTKAEHGTGRHDLAIGETATFSLTVTVPEGTSQEITVTDNLPANANGVMEYISSNIVSVGANLSPAVTPTPVVTDANLGDSINDRAVWSFGQVVNNATDGAVNDDDRIIIEITGRLVDVATNVDAKRPRNNSSVKFGTGLTDTSNLNMDTVEPKLQIDKSSATTTADGGDTVSFVLEVSHTSASTQEAFDVVVKDSVPAGLTYLPGTFQLMPSASCSVTPVIDESAPDTTGLVATFDNLPRADTCQLGFDATLDATVNPNQVITNVANLDWDSLAADSDPNERDYATSDDHKITVTKPGLSKIVFATSETSTNSSINGPETDLTIGEVVSYRFTTTISEGETQNVVITDQLPTAGIALEYVSSRIVSIGSQLTLGAHAVSDAGDDCLPGLCDSNTDSYRDKAQWNLGTIVNIPDGSSDANDQIEFEVIALVVDDNVNSGGADDLINTATMSFTNDAGNPVTGTVAVDLVEPVLNISKQATPAASPFFADAGDVISFEISVAHDAVSNADAFNLEIEDTLANNGAIALMDTFGNVGGTCGAMVDATNAASTPFKVVFDLPVLALASGSCTITYDVTVNTLAAPGQTLQNLAALQYDSTPVFVSGETRRSTANTSAEVVINAPGLVKIVSNTSLADTAQSQHDALLEDLTIGELVTYSITMKFPEGTAGNVVLSDTMPTGTNGVIEINGTPVVALGANITTTNSAVSVNAGNDGFTINLGTVTNTPDNADTPADLVTVTVTGIVIDDSNNADAKAPVNSATFSYTGGTPLTDTASVDLVEPDMAVTKSMTITNGLATITVNLINNGTASAYEAEVKDVLDSSNWDTAKITPVTVPSGFTLTISAGPSPTETTVVMASDGSSAPPANSVEPSETVTFQFSVPVVAGVSSINNTATNTQVTTMPGTDSNERAKGPVSGNATLGIPLVELSKEATAFADTNGDTEVGGVGDVITYNFTVTNTGGVALSNVTVSDLNPAVTVTGNPISLAVGEGDSTTIKGSYTITQADMNLGTLQNTARVTADGPTGTGSTTDDSDDPNDNTDNDTNSDGEPDDPTIVTLPRNPLYNMAKTASPASLSAPGTITYTFTFTNNGNVGLTNLTVSDANIDANTLSCNGDGDNDDAIDTLGLGATQTCSATRTVTQAQINAGVALTNTATPSATDLDGTTSVSEDTTLSDNSTSTPIIQNPSYTMVKSASPVSVSAPGTITYTFTFSNTGNVGLTNLTVNDANIDANTLSCNGDGDNDDDIDTLGLGATQTCSATRAVTQAQIDAGTALTNTATSSVTGPDGSAAVVEADTSDNSTSTPVVQNPAFTMVKSASPASVSAPGTITYTFTFSNMGNVGLTNLTVNDANIDANTLSCNGDGDNDDDIDTLGLSATQTCSATRTVTQAQIDAGTALTNTATASVKGPDGSTAVVEADTSDNSTSTPVVQSPAFSMVKSASPASVSAPGTITYTFTFTNTGNVGLTNLTVNDANIDANTLSCNGDGDNDDDIDTLGLGATQTCSATRTVTQAQIDAGDALTNTATSSVTGPDGTTAVVEADTSDNSTSTPVTQSPDYTMTKRADQATISAPGTITYTFTFTNTGNVGLTNLTVNDANIDANTLSCNGDGDNDDDIDTLAVGATETCSATRTITQAQIDAGDALTNTASSSATGPDGTTSVTEDDSANDNATSTSVTQSPNYTMTKRAGQATIGAPGTITYTFTFENTGNVELSNLTVVDGNIDANTLSCNGDGDNDVDIDTLAVAATQTCSATRTVTQAQINAGDALTNTATSSATGPDGTTPVTEDDSANDNATSTSVAQAASYTMAKTSDKPTMNTAGTITYTFTFVNTGNVGLTNLTVSDTDIDANTLSCNGDGDNDVDIDTLAVAATQTCSATRTITQAQIEAGPDIVNTATPFAKGPDGVATVAEDDSANDNSTRTDTLQSPTADNETQHNLLVGTPTLVNVVDGDTDPDGIIDLSTVNLTSNKATDTDNDGDSDQLVVTGEGTWTVDDVRGEITFTPEPGFQGDPTPINYSVKDNDGNTSNVANVVVTYGKPPLADHDAKANPTLGTSTEVDVLANDSDADGSLDPVTVQILGTSNPGDSLVIAGEGTWNVDTGTGRITFTPESGFNGDPTPIQYTVDDSDGNTSNPAKVTVTYGDAPIAADDSKHNPVVGTATELDVVVNDGDPDGSIDITTVQIVGTSNPGDALLVAGQGEWSIDQATGKITFTPVAGFDADPSPIQYTVDDDAGNSSNPATVRVTYGERPVASPDGEANPVVGTPTLVDLVGNDNDVDGSIDPASVKIVNPPAGSTLSADGKTLTVPGEGEWVIDAATGVATFTPEAGFVDDPAPVAYTISDNDGNVSDLATVTVTYGEPPQATDDNKHNPVLGSATVVAALANDNDTDGSLDPATLQIVGTSIAGESLVVAGQGEWTIDPLTGDITFTPEAGFTGDPVAIHYTVRDNDANISNTATLTVTYGEPPVAANDSKHNPVLGSTTVIDVANNDNDPDGNIDLASLLIVSNPPGSTLSADQLSLIVPGEGEWKLIPGTGILSFTPEAGFVGNPTPINYTLEDNHGNLSNLATATVTYGSGPVTTDDSKHNPVIGTETEVAVVANDSDTDGTLDPATVQIAGTGNAGDSLRVAGQGEWRVNPATGSITFVPESSFTGDPNPVTYTLKDNDGNLSSPATVTVTYGKPPVTASVGKANLLIGSATVVSVLGNDNDPDGNLDPATIQIAGTANPGDALSVPGQGEWRVNTSTGNITFVPESGFTGDPDPITYTVKDNDGNLSNPATVTVTYGSAPVAVDDSQHNPIAGSETEVLILANDTDAEGTLVPATVQITGTGNPGDSLLVAGQGEWQVNPATGSITFVPEDGLVDDPDPIQYTVKDNDGNVSNPATVTVTYDDPVTDATIEGLVWIDQNKNGVQDPGETGVPGWTIQVYDEKGVLVTGIEVNEDGTFRQSGFDLGDYTVRFVSPDGLIMQEQNISLTYNERLALALYPIDPSGVVYDESTGVPVAGARVSLINKSTGLLLHPACVGAGEQGQVTGSDGVYMFFLSPGADASCPASDTEYLIHVVPPTQYLLSINNPPAAGVLDSDNCTIDAVPGISCEVSDQTNVPIVGIPAYYMQVELGAGDPGIFNNHIPLTSKAQAVPTLSEWARLVLILLLGLFIYKHQPRYRKSEY